MGSNPIPRSNFYMHSLSKYLASACFAKELSKAAQELKSHNKNLHRQTNLVAEKMLRVIRKYLRQTRQPSPLSRSYQKKISKIKQQTYYELSVIQGQLNDVLFESFHEFFELKYNATVSRKQTRPLLKKIVDNYTNGFLSFAIALAPLEELAHDPV